MSDTLASFFSPQAWADYFTGQSDSGGNGSAKFRPSSKSTSSSWFGSEEPQVRKGTFRGGGNYVYEVDGKTVRIISGPTGVGSSFSVNSDIGGKIVAELASLGWPVAQGAPQQAMPSPKAVTTALDAQTPSGALPMVREHLADHWPKYAFGVGAIAIGWGLYRVYQTRQDDMPRLAY